MIFGVEMKLVGDGYAGGFSCGLTMAKSRTIEGFKQVGEESKADEQIAIYRNEAGVVLESHVKQDGAAKRVHTVVRNESGAVVTMEMLASFVLKNVEADKIHRLQSFWSAEGKLRTETIEELHLEPSWNYCGLRIEKFGNVGSMPVRKYYPFLGLENSKTGKVVGIQLYSPSSWQMEILCKEDDTLMVTGGIADREFGHWMKKLEPGESFATPEAVIAEGDSLYDVCDTLVKAQHPAISTEDGNMDIMFNEYCTTWGNPSYENVKKICDKIAGKGIKFLVIDAGWYGDDNWWDCMGDWQVNETKFPGGMKPIADYIREKGMVPGLWFEFESVARACRYFGNGDYVLTRDGIPLHVGDRQFWDMENPKVIEILDKTVIKQLKDSGYGYIKVDYNDSIGIGVDGAESLGEGLRRKILASQAFFKKIGEEIPGIVIENCSSGGHRLEPSMMSLASQASFSDAHETVAIPLIAANMHRMIKPEQCQIWAVMRAKDSVARTYYSIIATMLGRMCLSGDIYDLSDEQWKLIEDGMAFYHRVAPIIKDGKTTLIQVTNRENSTSYNHPMGQQVVMRELDGKGICILHRFENSYIELPEKLKGKKILDSYGKADCDFSAQVWLYEV